MAQPTHQAARRERAEDVAMLHLIERLTSQFPEVPRETIVNAIRGDYDSYHSSKIRDYVPILVERSVRASLRRSTGNQSRA